MIELSEEQRKALQDGNPVRVRESGQEYILLRPDVYDRLADEDYDDGPWDAEELDRLRVDIATPEGKASGLDQNSLVSGLFLATVFGDRVDRVIGSLSPRLMQQVDGCLKAALALP